MKHMQSIFMVLLLLLLSACYDFDNDKATRNSLNVINMKVGASTTMSIFFEEPYFNNDFYYNNLFFDDWSNTFLYDTYPYSLFPYADNFYSDPYGFYYAKGYDANGSNKRYYDVQTYFTSIKYEYVYGDSKQYYLNITDRSFLMFETYGSENIKIPASNLRNREQSLLIFGSSSPDSTRHIPLDVRVFTNVKATRADRVSINFINALPTENSGNQLPGWEDTSTVHLEVGGVRVSEPVNYRENDRFEIAGVSDTLENISLTLVLSNGASLTWNKKLQNGHTYNVVVGHSQNRLSAEPTLYVYDVTPKKDNA